MFDTMTLTKSAGALCGSLLVFLLGGWAAEAIYSVGGEGEDQVQGYVIDTGTDEAEQEEAPAGPDMAALFASADASKGERVFNQCRACHNVAKGENGVGPYLYGVVGRKVGSADGYGYSGALSEVVDVWSADELYAFLENPQGYAPGTIMGYAGLAKPEDRANLITYLDKTDGEDNIQLASAEPAKDAATAGDETTADDSVVEEAATEEPATEEPATDQAEPVTEDPAAAEEAQTEDAAMGEATPEETDTTAAESTTEAPEAADTASADVSEFATMVASADPDAGKKVFRQCQACHQAENERNGVGPHLVGVVGRDIAAAEGFKYSDALMGLDGVWTLDELSAWIENPRGYAPGNRMGYPGLKDQQDRANVLAYLKSTGN